MGRAKPIKIKRTKTKGYRMYFADGTLVTDNSFKSESDAWVWLENTKNMRSHNG